MASPQSVSTNEELLSLDRDNIDSGGFWFLVSEDDVSIGTSFHTSIEIPKKDFDVFVKFYLEDQPDGNLKLHDESRGDADRV
jgi:hypothetical protein